MKKFLNSSRESGMVLVTVLMMTMAMSIFAISILSQRINQSSAARAQVQRIAAQQLVKGAFWQYYADTVGNTLVPGPNGAPVRTQNISLNGTAYVFTIPSFAPANGSQFSVNVQYP